MIIQFIFTIYLKNCFLIIFNHYFNLKIINLKILFTIFRIILQRLACYIWKLYQALLVKQRILIYLIFIWIIKNIDKLISILILNIINYLISIWLCVLFCIFMLTIFHKKKFIRRLFLNILFICCITSYLNIIIIKHIIAIEIYLIKNV